MPDKPNKQIEKFKEAARQLETDESEEKFDQIVKKIAKTKPEDKDRKKQSDS
ncbi:hypothetical protein [Mesorhizobium sp. ORS 3428]|uniref:hypothetical protein n=1 Tax=Mesorhizobium sp. ORS 3428 TaxID=540997 RepID=UPI0015607F9A|nr:hypothetical protein [Mesorhizobium sp. ORS 3428]